MLDFSVLERAAVRCAPYRYLMAEGALAPGDAEAARRDYPVIDRTGFLPLSRLQSKGAFAALIRDLMSTRLAEILSEKLTLDLHEKPRLITVRRLSKTGDGRIHNDSESKICTMLIYLNERWGTNEGGAVRALNGPAKMDDYAEELAPVAGNVFAFARSENSWHGHPPFTGERYVVQTTFLSSQAALERKEQRGAVQFLLKKLMPAGA